MKTKVLMLFLIISLSAFGQEHKLITSEQLKKEISFVLNVEGNLDTLKVDGYDNNDKIVHRSIVLPRGKALGIWTTSYKPTLSIMTIPFKVRPSTANLPQNVTTGLSNAGLNIGFFNKRLDRYFVNNKNSTHNFSLGFLLAPSAEKLTPDNTNNIITKESTQLFISTGLSLTYSYGDISISLIPAGIDFATTSDGKNYAYNGKYWWGFGIGIKTSLIGL